MATCADCSQDFDYPLSDSPTQQTEGVPPEQQHPTKPRPLCKECYETALKDEYGADTVANGPEAPPRPNVGDVPAEVPADA
jgi:hypothetical protein